MMRIDGWEKRLVDLIGQASGKPFEYGKFDCCLFACDAVKAVTGIDARAEIFPEPYQSEEEADKILLKYDGIKGVIEKAAQSFGFRPVPVLFAQRGDIVMAEIKGVESLGVCAGKDAVFPSKEGGIVRIRITSRLLTKAWRT